MDGAKLTLESAGNSDEVAAESALQYFNQIELDVGLFDVYWAGLQVWPIVRLAIFQTILTAIGVFSYRAVLHSPPAVDRALVCRNPLLRMRRRRVMVFRWGQTMRHNGAPFDVYTDPYADALCDHDAEVVDLSPFPVDEGTILSKHTVRSAPLTRTWGRIAAGFWPAVSAPDNQIVKKLNVAAARISNEFGANIDLLAIAHSSVTEFFRQKHLWSPVFKIRRPSLVVFGTQSYGFEGVIAAARASGAVVAEIQHGLIYPGHLAYEFPDLRKIDHKPDILLTFGNWWTKRFNYPANMEQYPIGFLALENARKDVARSPCSERVLILTGDQLYGEAIPEVISSLRRRHPDIRVSIRPHPSDSFDYERALQYRHIVNVEIANPRTEGIHQFLLRGTRTLGAASTALIESAALGLPTVGVLGGMTSLMRPVVEASGTSVCNNFDKLGDALFSAQISSEIPRLFDRADDRFRAFLSQYA